MTQAKYYDSGSGTWKPVIAGPAGTPGIVTSNTAPTNTNVLWYDTSVSAGQYSVSQLSDASIGSPSTGQALVYNGSVWVNSTISGVVNANYVINGGFDFWQRSTSATQGATTTGYPSADRWKVYSSGASAPALTLARDTSVPTGVPVSYSAKFSWTASTSTGDVILGQMIENGKYLFAGQTVTVSFYAKATTAITVAGHFDQDYSAQSHNITTAWQRFSYTLTLPSTYQSSPPVGVSVGNNTEIRLIRLTNTSSAANDIWVTGVQVEAGTSATPFKRSAINLQGELVACQRYYYKMDDTNLNAFSAGAMYSTTAYYGVINYPTMRTTPNVTITSAAAVTIYQGGTTAAANAASFVIGLNTARVNFTRSVAGTAGYGAWTQWNTSAGANYIAVEAEL